MSNITKNQTPLLSVCMSSHNEFEILKRTINTFFDRASNPDDIEILIRIDDEANRSKKWIDDVRTCAGLKRHMQIIIVTGPQNYGYCSVPDNITEMAKLSTGEFIGCMADDYKDIDQGYDKHLQKWKGKCVLLTQIAEQNTHRWDTPIVHRKIFELTETMSICEFANYHYDVFDREVPELVKDGGFTVYHTPTAEFGLNCSLGLQCNFIKDDDYRLNKDDDYYPNQEGSKWDHFIKHYISKVKQFVIDNPEFDPNIGE